MPGGNRRLTSRVRGILGVCAGTLTACAGAQDQRASADTAAHAEQPRETPPADTPAPGAAEPTSNPATAVSASETPPAPPSPPEGPPRYDVPVRTDAELASALHASCEHAVAQDRPLLLEFSAAWCKDCVRLLELKRDAALSAELARWQGLDINILDGLHPELLRTFRVNAIARWVALRPRDCAAPIEKWARLGDRTMDSSRGSAPVTPGELADWLARARR